MCHVMMSGVTRCDNGWSDLMCCVVVVDVSCDDGWSD